MKKLLGIVVLGLLFGSNTNAWHKNLELICTSEPIRMIRVTLFLEHSLGGDLIKKIPAVVGEMKGNAYVDSATYEIHFKMKLEDGMEIPQRMVINRTSKEFLLYLDNKLYFSGTCQLPKPKI